eukprot:TRINITY_DN6069_c0_g1_i1.p1 TRINITY_DN6069_c0_g1~~TRINITY_DN6069_c0_g1_i1.p1  ORF type:complete len:236 (-),score=57.97 TRINITY_DN6069_c0_g1_i1:16-723(-)
MGSLNSSARNEEKGTCDAKRKRKILAFGASLTAGYYNSGCDFAPYSVPLEKMLAEFEPFEIVERGISGQKSEELKERLSDLLKQDFYDFVLILGGSNDLPSLPEDHTVGNLEAMVRDVIGQKKGDVYSRCLIMTLPWAHGSRIRSLPFGTLPEWLNSKRSKVNEMIKEMAGRIGSEDASRRGVMVVDLENHDGLCPSKMTEKEMQSVWDWDGLHFLPEGYDRMAKAIFETLRENL